MRINVLFYLLPILGLISAVAAEKCKYCENLSDSECLNKLSGMVSNLNVNDKYDLYTQTYFADQCSGLTKVECVTSINGLIEVLDNDVKLQTLKSFCSVKKDSLSSDNNDSGDDHGDSGESDNTGTGDKFAEDSESDDGTEPSNSEDESQPEGDHGITYSKKKVKKFTESSDSKISISFSQDSDSVDSVDSVDSDSFDFKVKKFDSDNEDSSDEPDRTPSNDKFNEDSDSDDEDSSNDPSEDEPRLQYSLSSSALYEDLKVKKSSPSVDSSVEDSRSSSNDVIVNVKKLIQGNCVLCDGLKESECKSALLNAVFSLEDESRLYFEQMVLKESCEGLTGKDCLAHLDEVMSVRDDEELTTDLKDACSKGLFELQVAKLDIVAPKSNSFEISVTMISLMAFVVAGFGYLKQRNNYVAIPDGDNILDI